MISENGEIISRGCTSDDDENAQNCQDNSQFCFTCNDNGCNNVVHRAPALSCITCDILNLACMWGHESGAAVRCIRDVLLTQQESCFIFKHEQHGLFMRGCTLETNICGMYADAECQICEEDGCNNVQVEEQYCIYCNSEDNQACLKDANTLPQILCEGNLQYSMRGCYSINKDSLVTRGCFNDLDSESRWDCDRDISNETCTRCFGNGCNTVSFNYEAKLEISVALIILSAILTKFI